MLTVPALLGCRRIRDRIEHVVRAIQPQLSERCINLTEPCPEHKDIPKPWPTRFARAFAERRLLVVTRAQRESKPRNAVPGVSLPSALLVQSPLLSAIHVTTAMVSNWLMQAVALRCCLSTNHLHRLRNRTGIDHIARPSCLAKERKHKTSHKTVERVQWE